VPSHGRQSHFHVPLYISVVILHIKQTGGGGGVTSPPMASRAGGGATNPGCFASKKDIPFVRHPILHYLYYPGLEVLPRNSISHNVDPPAVSPRLRLFHARPRPVSVLSPTHCHGLTASRPHGRWFMAVSFGANTTGPRGL
jgi:hypothetical protein